MSEFNRVIDLDQLFLGSVDPDWEPRVLSVKIRLEDVHFERQTFPVGLGRLPADSRPVNLFEEVVPLDLLDAFGAHSEAIFGLDLQKALKDVSRIIWEHARYHRHLHRDVFVHLHLVFVVVGREPDEHLVEQNT